MTLLLEVLIGYFIDAMGASGLLRYQRRQLPKHFIWDNLPILMRCPWITRTPFCFPLQSADLALASHFSIQGLNSQGRRMVVDVVNGLNKLHGV